MLVFGSVSIVGFAQQALFYDSTIFNYYNDQVKLSCLNGRPTDSARDSWDMSQLRDPERPGHLERLVD